MVDLKLLSDRERNKYGQDLTELLVEHEDFRQMMEVLLHGMRIRYVAQTKAFEFINKHVKNDHDAAVLREVFSAAVRSRANSEVWSERDLPKLLADVVMPFLVQQLESGGDTPLADQLKAARQVCSALMPKPLRIDSADREQAAGVCSVITHVRRNRVADEVAMLWKWALRNEYGIILLGGGTKSHEVGTGVILPPKLWKKTNDSAEALTALLLSAVDRLGRPCDLVVVSDGFELLGRDRQAVDPAATLHRAVAAVAQAAAAVNATAVVGCIPPADDRAHFLAKLDSELRGQVNVYHLSDQE